MFMGRSLEGFMDQERTRAWVVLLLRAGEGLIMEAWAEVEGEEDIVEWTSCKARCPQKACELMEERQDLDLGPLVDTDEDW